jgi:hypothetical protein
MNHDPVMIVGTGAVTPALLPHDRTRLLGAAGALARSLRSISDQKVLDQLDDLTQNLLFQG